MRHNSRNSHVFSAKLAQRIRLFEALGTTTPSVLDRLESGEYVRWRALYPLNTGETEADIYRRISELYNNASGVQGRGEVLIKHLIDEEKMLRAPVVLGKANNPWDLFIEGETYEVKQTAPSIVLGSASSIAAAKLRNNLRDICQQIISFCKSVILSRKTEATRSRLGDNIQMLLKTAVSLDNIATRGSIGKSYFEDLGQLVTDVTNYDADASELPTVSIDANLTIGDSVYNSQLDNLQTNLEKLSTIRNVLFPDEDLYILSSAELHHEVFDNFGSDFSSWATGVLKATVEEAFEEMPENLQGFFLVDPQGARFVRKDLVKTFTYSGVVRSRIALVVPPEYRQ